VTEVDTDPAAACDFAIHGVTVRVQSGLGTHRDRLVGDFRPFVTKLSVAPEITVEIYEGDAAAGDDLSPSATGPLGNTIAWDKSGRLRIYGPYLLSDSAYLHEVRSYFAAAVLQRLVIAREVQQVHASGVVGRRGAVLFAGDRGAGKTSLALASTLAGAKYLSNDIALLERGPSVVHALGLPQSLTLGPGGAGWFTANFPELRLPAARAGRELTDKVRLDCGVLALDPGPARLSGIVFPERMDVLECPRARRLSTGEALVRLVSVTEAIAKWQQPPALLGGAYVDRLRTVCEAAAEQAESWHLQWSNDHHRNVALLQELVL
jgi:hypothetical protein